MAKSRRRKIYQRPKSKIQKPTTNAQIRLPFLNVGGLSHAEVKAARQPSTPRCVSCDGNMHLYCVLAWRGANGTPYVAAFCKLCITETSSPGVDRTEKPTWEIELKIDCEVFSKTCESVQEIIAGSGVNR